ncbi:Hypothetical protein D9617_30g011100 [Elsinoe fawcettii]|nr:Hypothetical protein D9617_30g011100 [Elsinoe fawcettii]
MLLDTGGVSLRWGYQSPTGLGNCVVSIRTSSHEAFARFDSDPSAPAVSTDIMQVNKSSNPHRRDPAELPQCLPETLQQSPIFPSPHPTPFSSTIPGFYHGPASSPVQRSYHASVQSVSSSGESPADPWACQYVGGMTKSITEIMAGRAEKERKEEESRKDQERERDLFGDYDESDAVQ